MEQCAATQSRESWPTVGNCNWTENSAATCGSRSRSSYLLSLLVFALSVLLACNCKSNTVFSKSIVCGATDKLVLTVSIKTLKLLTYLNPELFNLLVTKVFLRTRD